VKSHLIQNVADGSRIGDLGEPFYKSGHFLIAPNRR
jgi:hypothetical protein